MTLQLASTFTDALTRLSAAEQKQVKLTAFDLQMDPRGNGLQMHRVEKSDGFWTARVSQDVRIVLHKAGEASLLAYVGHHDDAYRWAERRRMIPHERTGAMQLVELRTVQADEPVAASLTGGVFAPPPPASLPIHCPFANLDDDQLLDVGVPRDWLAAVRGTVEAEVDALFAHLPAEAAEALLDHATGGRIEDHAGAKVPAADPYAHPDAQRRFRTVDDLDELRAALDQPFEKWAVFLHPVQRALAERDWSGPARVSGSAGTGKTIVALHRAVHLARAYPDANVLLTTFSPPLAASLSRKRDVLTQAEPGLRARIVVRALDEAAMQLHADLFGPSSLATPAQLRAAIQDAKSAGLGQALSPAFLWEEWHELVDAWNVVDAESYAAVPRIGRRTRLGAGQREAAWSVFAYLRQRLEGERLTTQSAIYARLTGHLGGGGDLPFTHVVVDEAQDLSVAQVRFLSGVGTGRGDALFLAGDIGQRIFHLPFSWARLGLDIRGRSHCLKVNYRTSHQIRVAADRLLPSAITDMDGIEEGRRGTVSVFDGPAPHLLVAADGAAERDGVAAFLRFCLAEGIAACEIGLLVRGDGQIVRARAARAVAGRGDDTIITTMHGAKGLEFGAVAVMACDEDVLPDPARLAAIGDTADLEAAYDTERHLLYVACTRARDRLMVSGVAPGSEFLSDLGVGE